MNDCESVVTMPWLIMVTMVNPLLEKPGLDLSYKNDRPISNLHYVISSKLSGKARIQTN